MERFEIRGTAARRVPGDRRRATEQCDEVASSDRSITSSTGVRAPSRSRG